MLKPTGLTNQQFSLLMALNRPNPPPMGPVASLLAMPIWQATHAKIDHRLGGIDMEELRAALTEVSGL